MKNIFIIAFIIAGCNSSQNAGNPKVVVEKFVDALSRKDITTARSLTTADSKFFLDQMENSINKNEDGIQNLNFNKSDVEFGEATINGDNATVPVKELKSGEGIDVPLKKENGEWKISIDITSMMNMAMKKMEEKGINLTDSLKEGMSSFRNLNIDSLKIQMNEKGISIDSIKNEMRKRGINLDSLNGTIRFDTSQ